MTTLDRAVMSVGGEGCLLLLMLAFVPVPVLLLEAELDCSCGGGLLVAEATLGAAGLAKSRKDETGGVGKLAGVAVAVEEAGGVGNFAAVVGAADEIDVVREDRSSLVFDAC